MFLNNSFIIFKLLALKVFSYLFCDHSQMNHPLKYFPEHFLEYWLFYFMFLSIIFKDLLFFPSESLFAFLCSSGRFATEH